MDVGNLRVTNGEEDIQTYRRLRAVLICSHGGGADAAACASSSFIWPGSCTGGAEGSRSSVAEGGNWPTRDRDRDRARPQVSAKSEHKTRRITRFAQGQLTGWMGVGLGLVTGSTSDWTESERGSEQSA